MDGKEIRPHRQTPVRPRRLSKDHAQGGVPNIPTLSIHQAGGSSSHDAMQQAATDNGATCCITGSRGPISATEPPGRTLEALGVTHGQLLSESAHRPTADDKSRTAAPLLFTTTRTQFLNSLPQPVATFWPASATTTGCPRSAALPALSYTPPPLALRLLAEMPMPSMSVSPACTT